MNEATRSERIQYLDVLRVLSMLAVVFLHTVAGTLRAFFGSSQWHFANGVSSLATAGVPLFFLLSGALLLSGERSASVGYTLKKRLPRVLVPFLIWSLLAVAYYVVMTWLVKGAPDWTTAVGKLKHLPAQPTAVHLWFMYALIPLYFLSPFIKKLLDSLDRSLIIYLFSLWAFFSVVLPTAAGFLPASLTSIVTLDPRYDLSLMAGYAGYFVAGYYLMRLERRVSPWLLGGVVVADVFVIALGTWLKTGAQGSYSEVFKSYTRLFVVILSCALFLLCKELFRARRLGRAAAAAVGFLTPLAFGIYLVHNLLVDLLSRLVPWWPATSIGIVVASYLAVLAASVVLIFVVSRIKPLCYVLTGQVYAGWGKRGRALRGATLAPGTVEAPASRRPAFDAPPARYTVATDILVPDSSTTELPRVWRPETPVVRPPAEGAEPVVTEPALDQPVDPTVERMRP